MKNVSAVPPFIFEFGCNFKLQPFMAWVKIGGKTANPHYSRIAHHIHFPHLAQFKNEARFRFVEACTINYDTFPDYICYEIIPMIWDCWPQYDDVLVHWLQKKHVRACIFTSSLSAQRIQERIPELRILVITEGYDVTKCHPGLNLKDRPIDFYSYGRAPGILINSDISPLRKARGGSDEKMKLCWQNSKIVLALPQCDVLPQRTGGQETLTQRYWECMLSRMIMIGRAPKELRELIGYNPVIDLDVSLDPEREDVAERFAEQVKDIVNHIEEYQELVDKNRETALRIAPWEIRMKQVREWLTSLGYKV